MHGRPNCVVYEPYTAIASRDSERFYQPESQNAIRQTLLDVIHHEAPISLNLLQKRVFASWQIKRAATRAESAFGQALATVTRPVSQSGERRFYWREHQIPDQYPLYRVPQQTEDRRNMEDIAPQEVANAVMTLLREQISLDVDDLIRETARIFGFSRLGSVIALAVRAGIDEAVRRGGAEWQDEQRKIRLQPDWSTQYKP